MIPLYYDETASQVAMVRQNAKGATKVWEDLERYDRIIEQTKPEIIIECGTWQGGSAAWFAAHGIEVVTIDLFPVNVVALVTQVVGNSVDLTTVAKIENLVDPTRRTMVVLDSDHSAEHVTAEIRAYAGLVTPGCYLVVEDAIVEGPRLAIESELVDNPLFTRDVEVEKMHPVTMFPAGWWRRCTPQ